MFYPYPIKYAKKRDLTISVRVNSEIYEELKRYELNISEWINQALIQALNRIKNEEKREKKNA